MASLFRCTISEIVNGRALNLTHSSKLPEPKPAKPAPRKEYHRDLQIHFDMERSDCISPLLCGDNLEHTRGCICGGLSAQMLKNRKFAGEPTRDGCAREWYSTGDAFFTFDDPFTSHGEGYKINRTRECHSQRITSYNDTVCGIGQSGLALQKGKEYELLLTARVFSPMTLHVTLKGAEGIYDEQTLSLTNTEFRTHALTLRSDRDDSDAGLEITFRRAGSVTFGAISLMPADHFRGMRRDVIDALKQMGIRLLRWPGGNFAGDYHWKDGLLPREQRAPLQSYLWIKTQPHSHGYDFHEFNTDDFIALCHRIGATPYITINPTWNTPEESAEWVEYCNGDEATPMGALRAERGHREPYNVHFWSLGNEFGYGHMEGANNPADYTRAVSAHAKRMLEVSPSIVLCSSGIYPDEDWVTFAAKPLQKLAPVVSMHHYVYYPKFIDPDKRAEDYYGMIEAVNAFLVRIQKQRALLGEDGPAISFDEWNIWEAWYRGGSVTEGIFAAHFLNMLFENADPYTITMACHFESVNEGGLRVYPTKVVATPMAQAIALMYTHGGGTVCALQEDVVATRKDGVVTCTLINRSFDKEKRFFLSRVGEVVEASLYSSEDVLPNTAFAITPLSKAECDGQDVFTLPPHSIALIKIKL